MKRNPFFRKLFNSWQHFGTAMTLSKAFEKFVIDKRRFRGNISRTAPVFPERPSPPPASPPSPPAAAPLSICYLLHYFFPDKQGGTERFVLNLAKQQQQLGNRVRVLTLGKRPRERYVHQTADILWEEFEFDGVPVTQFRYQRAPRGLYYDAILPDDPGMLAFAEEAFRRYQPEIIHFAYPQPFAAFAAACQAHNIPYLATLTDFNLFCHYSTMVRKDGQFCGGSRQGEECRSRCRTYGVKDTHGRHMAADALLAGAARITVPSEFVARVVAREFPLRSMQVIPHGIPPDFVPAAPRRATRNFLYAGTLSSLKGVHLLIKAFRELPGEAALNICGSGEPSYCRALRSLAAHDSRVSFLGPVSAGDMAGLYQAADCVVVPSIWYETYNFVLREALSCGCLAVVSNMGAMPEAIMEGENGFLFQAGETRSLRDALEKAAAFDWSRYRRMDFPTVREEAEQYQALYQEAKAGR